MGWTRFVLPGFRKRSHAHGTIGYGEGPGSLPGLWGSGPHQPSHKREITRCSTLPHPCSGYSAYAQIVRSQLL
jgi:hypothetical protein